jgi:hypothetical protein
MIGSIAPRTPSSLAVRTGTLAVALAALALGACKDEPAPRQAPPAATPAAEAPAAAANPQEVGRPGFRVTVPAGFKVGTTEKGMDKVPANALALIATERRNGMLASILVVPLDQAMPDAQKVATPEGCVEHTRQIAQGAASANARLERPQVTKAGAEPACAWELHVEGSTRGALGTFVPKGDRGWVITCNLLHDDAASVAACREVVASWKLE